MKKIFEEYGSIIVTAIAIVALIGVVAILSGGENGGVVGNALKRQVSSLAQASGGEIDGSISGTVPPTGSQIKPVITNYSLEEIEANVHLYAIGATQPEFVVAAFNDDYSEVVITQNGENSDGLIGSFDFMESPMYKNHDTLKTAVIKSGIKNIGYGLFESSYITSISLCEGITNIEDRAFMDCYFTSINIPSTVTNIGESAFYGCDYLETVSFSENLENIGPSAFYLCSALESIDIPDSVTSLGEQAFYQCSNLKSIDLSVNLTEISRQAFYGCSSLESVVIPDKVININAAAFYKCTNLTTATIPEGVTSMIWSVFGNCSSLSTIRGVAGSYAETFAASNGYTFIAI